jgi:hypothetical protein
VTKGVLMSVATKHPSYAAYENYWQALRDAYEGSGAIKTQVDPRREVHGVKMAGTRYLPRPLGMTTSAGIPADIGDQLYAAYRDRAVWGGFTEVVVHGMSGAIFRREPTLEAPAALTAQLEDVTQTGVPWRTFAAQAIRETLLMGRFGILVDFPSSLGDVPPPPSSRPYWIAYQAEEILNWRTMQRQGDTVLSLVVLKECVAEPQGLWPMDDFFVVVPRTQYRVLRLNEAGLYEQSLWRELPMARQGQLQIALEQVWLPQRTGVPLDFIPFVFLAPFSLEPAVEKSLLEPLVEKNYQYYRHSADYEHGLHMTALPTPYVCSSTDTPSDLLIGSATAWWIPDSQATVGMLEFHGQGLQSHERALENDIKEMASKGARLLEGAPLVPETATANMRRTEGAESPLQSLITTGSQGLTQALQIHAWWAGTTEDVDDTAITLTLNNELVTTTMEPAMLQALMTALLSGTISYETFYWNLQRGEIARPMIDVEEEQTLLEVREQARPLAAPAATPRNGTTATVAA